MEGRVEGWKDGRVEGWKGGRVEGWKGGRVEGWKDGRKDGRMEGWKDGRMEGWKDGRMEGRKDGKGGRVIARDGPCFQSRAIRDRSHIVGRRFETTNGDEHEHDDEQVVFRTPKP
jgi:hypothetical protein